MGRTSAPDSRALSSELTDATRDIICYPVGSPVTVWHGSQNPLSAMLESGSSAVWIEWLTGDLMLTPTASVQERAALDAHGRSTPPADARQPQEMSVFIQVASTGPGCIICELPYSHLPGLRV